MRVTTLERPVTTQQASRELPSLQPAAGSKRREPGKITRLALYCCRALLWLAVACYAVYFSAFTFMRHDHLGTTLFDMGIFDQAVWLISRGHSAFLSTRGLHPLADHFTPVLYALVPLYWVWDSPKALLAIQSVALALGAVPLFNISLHKTRTPYVALLIAISYLLYPPLQWMNNFDFHPESFAPVLILAALWYLECKRYGAVWAVSIVLLLCKETMGLVVMCVGIYACMKGMRRHGAALCAVGIAGLVIAMEVMRAFNHGQPSQYISLYAPYGDSASSIAAYIFTHPGRVWTELLSEVNVAYLDGLLAPVGFLALLAPEYLLFATPTLLANMLSDRPQMHTTIYQYNATVLPFIFVGVAEGVSVLVDLLGGSVRWRRYSATVVTSVYLGIATLNAIPAGPLAQDAASAQSREVGAQPLAAVREALLMIPPRASVSAQTAIGAQLTHRQRLYVFPNPFQPAAWGNDAVALRNQLGRSFYPLATAAFHERIARTDIDYVVLGPGCSSTFPLRYREFQYLASVLAQDRHYGAVFADGDILILKRGADFAAGRKLIRRAQVSSRLTFLTSDGER